MGSEESAKSPFILGGGIYRITCIPTGFAYVGQTTDFDARWATHKRDLESLKHCNAALQSDWLCFGGDVFLFEVMEIIPFMQWDGHKAYEHNQRAHQLLIVREWYWRLRQREQGACYNGGGVSRDRCRGCGGLRNRPCLDHIRCRCVPARPTPYACYPVAASNAQLPRVGRTTPAQDRP